jgi:hypothetical protein
MKCNPLDVAIRKTTLFVMQTLLASLEFELNNSKR